MIAGVSGHLFRRQIGRGTHHHPGRGERFRIRYPRDAEVGDQGPARLGVEQHILGLDIAVYHAPPVSVGKRAGHVGQHALGRLDREASVSLEPVRERTALHALHREVHQIVLLPDEVERHDVGMREPRDRLGLAAEPLQRAFRGDEIGRQDFHGEPALELEILHQEHDREPARAERALDPIAGAKGFLEPSGQLGDRGRRDAGSGIAQGYALMSGIYPSERAWLRPAGVFPRR